jgi:hypothetical protein
VAVAFDLAQIFDVGATGQASLVHGNDLLKGCDPDQ